MDTTKLYQTIVNTILSNKETQPEIIRQHIEQYAQQAGVSYELARQAVNYTVTRTITERLAQL